MKLTRGLGMLSIAAALLLSPWTANPIARADEEPSYKIEHDITYSSPADKPLLADVYEPRGTGPFPGILVVHGVRG